jgi:hypothetical protein
MSVPKSKSADGKPAAAVPATEEQTPVHRADGPPRRVGTPPPLPPSARLRTPNEPAPVAPYIPAPGPTVDPAASIAARLEPQKLMRSSVGFTALFEKTSLREWVHRIEVASCDAVVTVTTDHQRGQLWCIAGNVVDAEWGALKGEEAARQILALRSGDVSVKFGPVDRRRRISMPTRELLYSANRHQARRALANTHYDILAQNILSTGVLRLPPQQPPRFAPGARTLSVQLAPAPAAPPRRTDGSTYLAGALALLTLGMVAFGIFRLTSTPQPLASEAAPEQVRAALEAQTPLADIEVVPAAAEIWLDSKRIGTGHVLLAPIKDGLVHQLRFTMPGYAPKSAFFREFPPTGRVTLERETDVSSTK